MPSAWFAHQNSIRRRAGLCLSGTSPGGPLVVSSGYGSASPSSIAIETDSKSGDMLSVDRWTRKTPRDVGGWRVSWLFALESGARCEISCSLELWGIWWEPGSGTLFGVTQLVPGSSSPMDRVPMNKLTINLPGKCSKWQVINHCTSLPYLRNRSERIPRLS